MTDLQRHLHQPKAGRFHQQNLKAWNPVLFPWRVWVVLSAFGSAFLGVGVYLYRQFEELVEIRIDYTQCFREARQDRFSKVPAKYVTVSNTPSSPSYSPDSFGWAYHRVVDWETASLTTTPFTFPSNGSSLADTIIPTCQIVFPIPVSLSPPIGLYYEISNFYQNNRDYVASFSQAQLQGEPVPFSQIQNSACSPLDIDQDTGNIIYPCGLIANSLFNDSFSNLTFMSSEFSYSTLETKSLLNATSYPFFSDDITWPIDSSLYQSTSYDPATIIPPPNWRQQYPIWTEEALQHFNINNHFKVWMRPDGTPLLKKLYGINQDQSLQPGLWSISIEDLYPLEQFQSTKSIVISTLGKFGSFNLFLAKTYMATGILCFLLVFILIWWNQHRTRSGGDYRYLSFKTYNVKPEFKVEDKEDMGLNIKSLKELYIQEENEKEVENI